MIAPIVEQLASEYDGRAKVLKLDVDNNQQTATKFNIRSIPQILFFKNGKVVDTVVGAVPKSVLEASSRSTRPERAMRDAGARERDRTRLPRTRPDVTRDGRRATGAPSLRRSATASRIPHPAHPDLPVPGLLSIVSTPIGNLEDVTARAARVLREADAVLCEDTRHSRRLLDHVGSTAPTLALHEHNEARATEGWCGG
jgi:thiol-disulfide isomerase/thioredoxin